MRYIYKFFFYNLGWKIRGDVPRELKKYIIIVAPHSSNWDFLVGVVIRSIMKFPSNYLGKKELFTSPFGWFFRKLGGYPVDRNHHTNLVEQVVEIFNKEEQFVIAIAPEGTRKKVSKWKTGFYHIALKAKVPIVMVALDYANKNIIWSLPFYPKGNFEVDAKLIEKFYSGVKGKNCEVMSIVSLND